MARFSGSSSSEDDPVFGYRKQLGAGKWIHYMTWEVGALLVRHLMTCYNVVTIATTQEEVMRTVGVRELEEKIDEVLEEVRETGEVVAVTRDGEIIAHLVPAPKLQPPVEQPSGGIWTDFDRLVAEIGVHWPEGVSAVDAVRDVRREL